MKLDEFIGNNTVRDELSAAMESGSFPHAVMIEGARGTGKKTLADIIAAYCVCLEDKEKPCGKCPGCLKVSHRCHPDIFIVDGSQPGALSIENIRTIRSDAYIKPNEAPKKVYLILDCDKMLPPAQNALLKILEEPPVNVVFVMTVSSANMLLLTVRSRSRIYTLYPVSVDEAADALCKRFPDKDRDELLSIAGLYDGNIGEAVSSIENGDEQSARLAEDILTAAAKRKEYELLLLTSRLSASREFASETLNRLISLSGECIRASAGLPVSSEAAEYAADTLPQARLYKLAGTIGRAADILRSNVNLNFFGTWLCSALINQN